MPFNKRYILKILKEPAFKTGKSHILLYESGETLHYFRICHSPERERRIPASQAFGEFSYQPGKMGSAWGKTGAGETLEDAIVREVWEETGISIVPGEIAGDVTFELPEKKVIAIVYNWAMSLLM